jgi:hypothetical protein
LVLKVVLVILGIQVYQAIVGTREFLVTAVLVFRATLVFLAVVVQVVAKVVIQVNLDTVVIRDYRGSAVQVLLVTQVDRDIVVTQVWEQADTQA